MNKDKKQLKNFLTLINLGIYNEPKIQFTEKEIDTLFNRTKLINEQKKKRVKRNIYIHYFN